MPLGLLLEDNHCLALVKPGGLPTQAPPGADSLEARAKAYLKEKHHKPGNVYLGVPHRLDRAVSGVVLFARNSKAAARLAEQFEKRQVRKTYWALVEGEVEPPAGVWEDWIAKVQGMAQAVAAEPGTPGARRAELRYRVLNRQPGQTFLEIELVTGRMHQIRVQAARRGWPVRGDFLYGARTHFGPDLPLPQGERVIALHHRTLTFLHPLRYEPVTLTAPLPDYWGGELTTPESPF